MCEKRPAGTCRGRPKQKGGGNKGKQQTPPSIRRAMVHPPAAAARPMPAPAWPPLGPPGWQPAAASGAPGAGACPAGQTSAQRAGGGSCLPGPRTQGTPPLDFTPPWWVMLVTPPPSAGCLATPSSPSLPPLPCLLGRLFGVDDTTGKVAHVHDRPGRDGRHCLGHRAAAAAAGCGSSAEHVSDGPPLCRQHLAEHAAGGEE